MLVNVVVYVPSTLLKFRFEGAVMSLPFGVFIGSVFIYLFQSSLNKFDFKDITEILSDLTPNWIRSPLLIILGSIGFITGLLTLLAFNNIAIRYLNPEIAGINLITIFSLFIIISVVNLSSSQVLYTLETLLILNLPLILLVTFQVFTNDYITWNSILEVLSHWREFPSWNALAASVFVFSGFTHMMIFYRAFNEKVKIQRFWFLPLLGLFNLATTFFIPIGLLGADGVIEYTFPWVVTADSLQFEYGPVERIISVFLLLYLSISVLSVIVQWHVSSQLILGLMNTRRLGEKKTKIFTWIILGIFGVFVLVAENILIEEQIFHFGETWLNIRFLTETFTVFIMWILARRIKT